MVVALRATTYFAFASLRLVCLHRLAAAPVPLVQGTSNYPFQRSFIPRTNRDALTASSVVPELVRGICFSLSGEVERDYIAN